MRLAERGQRLRVQLETERLVGVGEAAEFQINEKPASKSAMTEERFTAVPIVADSEPHLA